MSNNICPSCFNRQYDAGRCGSCGFAAAEYKPERTALPLGSFAGSYRIGLMKFNSRQSQVYTAVHNETSTPVIIEEFFPAKLAGRAPNTAEVTLASGEPEIVQRYQQACLLIEASTQKRPLKRIETFRANNTVYSVFEPVGTVSIAAQCEMMADNPYYFRDQNGMPMMTINALPIPGMPRERTYDPNQYTSNGPNTQPSETNDNYPETVIQEAARRNRRRKLLTFGGIGAAAAVIIAAVVLFILPPGPPPPPPPVETTATAFIPGDATTPTPIPTTEEGGQPEPEGTEAGSTEEGSGAENNPQEAFDPNKAVIPGIEDVSNEITETLNGEAGETEEGGEETGEGGEETGEGGEEAGAGGEEAGETPETADEGSTEDQPQGEAENPDAETEAPGEEQAEPEESKQFLSREDFLEKLQLIAADPAEGYYVMRLGDTATNVDQPSTGKAELTTEKILPVKLFSKKLIHNSKKNSKVYVVTEIDGTRFRVPIFNRKNGEYTDEGALLSFRTWRDLGEGLEKETRVYFPIKESADIIDKKLNKWLEWKDLQIGLELSDGEIQLIFKGKDAEGSTITNGIVVVPAEKTPDDEAPAEETATEPAEAPVPEAPAEDTATEPAEEPAPEAPATEEPVTEPTEEPAPEPTEEPTPEPTEEPAPEPTEVPAKTDNVYELTRRDIKTPNGRLSITTNDRVASIIIRDSDGKTIRMMRTIIDSGFVWTTNGIDVAPGKCSIEYRMDNGEIVKEHYTR